MSLRSLTASIMGLICLGVLGCAQLPSLLDREKSQLPTPRLSPDSVVLEMTTIEAPWEAQIGPDSFWREVDEQILSVDARRRLTAAGLRCGTVGQQLPSELQQLLESAKNDANIVDPDGKSIDITGPRHRRLQCRAGQRQQIPLGESQKEMNLLWRDQGRVRGATYLDAQPLFVLRVEPRPTGDADLSLVPQILHGVPKNRYVGRDGMFLMETGKEEKLFDDLAIEGTLSLGECLVVGCTEGQEGLGERFFCTELHDPRPKLLILRLAQTQRDDVQGIKERAKPLVTPTE
jgi:hypothetical protein